MRPAWATPSCPLQTGYRERAGRCQSPLGSAGKPPAHPQAKALGQLDIESVCTSGWDFPRSVRPPDDGWAAHTPLDTERVRALARTFPGAWCLLQLSSSTAAESRNPACPKNLPASEINPES